MEQQTRDLLIERDELAIRRMRDELPDYQLMAKWLTDERVLEYYEGRDNPFPLDRVIAKYSPRVLSAESVTPCLILYAGVPIGYMQYDPTAKEAYDLDDDVNVFGTDLFIGEPDCWNKGIGTRAVLLLLNYLFDELHAARVVLDPEAWNTRAIRCYEKCGFKKVKLLPKHELHEGECRDSWLMIVDQSTARADILR